MFLYVLPFRLPACPLLFLGGAGNAVFRWPRCPAAVQFGRRVGWHPASPRVALPGPLARATLRRPSGEEVAVMECETCRFWRPSDWNDKSGECRRSAPTPKSDEGVSAYWPTTSKDDWCGEYEAESASEEDS